jgi:hypothetical protein
MLGAKKSRVPGRSKNKHGNATRAKALDLGAPDQGLCLVDSRGEASHDAAMHRRLRWQPSVADRGAGNGGH